MFLAQNVSNREAITPSGNNGNSYLLTGPALLPKLFAWLLPTPATTQRPLPVRSSAVSDVFRRQLLLAALAPNAP